MYRSMHTLTLSALLAALSLACSGESQSDTTEPTDSEGEPATAIEGDGGVGGSGADGDDDEASGGADGTGDGGVGHGRDGDGGLGEDEDTADFDQCLAACEMQAACVGLDPEACEAECHAQRELLDFHDCRAEGRAQNACLEGLTCESLMGYLIEGQRNHAECGDEADAYFSDCTIGAGTPPAECVEVCQAYEDCALLGVSKASCEERCTLQVTTLDFRAGATCTDAFLDLRACAAGASCEALFEWAENGTAPASCTAQGDALESACAP